MKKHLIKICMKSWLCDFLSFGLRRLKIPKIWRRALVVALRVGTQPAL